MKFLYSIFLIFCLAFNCCAQKVASSEASSDEKYILEARDFINEVYGNRLKLPRLVLVDQPKFGCEFSDVNNVLFNKEELILIKEQIKNLKIMSWNVFLKPTKNFISQDSLDKIFNNEYLRLDNGWTYFKKFLGSEINRISAPIFLRDYEYCLFYDDYSCDSKCGQGVLRLYRRENSRWVEVTELCSWIS